MSECISFAPCHPNTCEHDCLGLGYCVRMATPPLLKPIADALPALAKLEIDCSNAGFYSEAKIASGLLELLVDLVMSEAAPGTVDYEVAKAISEARA